MNGRFVLFISVGLLAWACQADPTSVATPGSPLAPSAATISTTDVFIIGTSDVVGTSSLIRNDHGMTMTFKSTGLPAGIATTVWWVIFNVPSACLTIPCTAADLNDATQASQVPATGHVIGGSGKGNYGAWIGVGDASEALFGPGLLDPLGAEIHLVVRSHGPAIPGMIVEQISTLNGGCPPNTCANLLVARHLP